VVSISTEEPPPLSEVRPDVPAALADIIERAMARSKHDRFRSAEELRDALLPFADEQAGRGALAATPPRPRAGALDNTLPAQAKRPSGRSSGRRDAGTQALPATAPPRRSGPTSDASTTGTRILGATTAPVGGGRRPWLMMAGVGGLAAIAGVAILVTRGSRGGIQKEKPQPLVALADAPAKDAAATKQAEPPGLTALQREDKERREKQSFAEFSAGRYQDAIKTLTQLYADYQEPAYHRHIGRSYEELGDPDRAIASYEEYLQKAKDGPLHDLAETQGRIQQLKERKKKRETAKDAAGKGTKRRRDEDETFHLTPR
jgi:hypothetical protein